MNLACKKIHHTHTHTSVRMFRVNRQRHRLILRLSVSRQCIGRICDTLKSLKPHTPSGSFQPTLTPGYTFVFTRVMPKQAKI